MGALLETVWGIVAALCGVIVGLPAPAQTAADPGATVVPCEHPPPAALPEPALGEPVLPAK